MEEEIKRKISEKLKGRKTWNKGLKGEGNSMFGKHHSEETREKIRQKRLERKERLGYINSIESREKISKTLTGNKNAIRNKAFTGRKHSFETIEKIKKTKKENPYIYNVEDRRKISISGKGRIPVNKGKPNSDEIRKKISIGVLKAYKEQANWRIGKHHSEETKKKLSKIHKEIGTTPPHFKGEQHPCWKGGISFEPYNREFNEEFKNKIRIRDDFICQKCGISNEDCINLFNSLLNIHHINYDKRLSIHENCISLCRRCHAESNWNRHSWILFYQDLLNRKYGYSYKDEMPIIMIESIGVNNEI